MKAHKVMFEYKGRKMPTGDWRVWKFKDGVTVRAKILKTWTKKKPPTAPDDVEYVDSPITVTFRSKLLEGGAMYAHIVTKTRKDIAVEKEIEEMRSALKYGDNIGANCEYKNREGTEGNGFDWKF
jgi:hypothetical protein